MRTALGLLLLVGCSTAAGGDFDADKLANWHHWRGPNADGSAPKADPPVKWGANNNIKWKAELGAPRRSCGRTACSSSPP
jgi:hypothetical protein